MSSYGRYAGGCEEFKFPTAWFTNDTTPEDLYKLIIAHFNRHPLAWQTKVQISDKGNGVEIFTDRLCGMLGIEAVHFGVAIDKNKSRITVMLYVGHARKSKNIGSLKTTPAAVKQEFNKFVDITIKLLRP